MSVTGSQHGLKILEITEHYAKSAQMVDSLQKNSAMSRNFAPRGIPKTKISKKTIYVSHRKLKFFLADNILLIARVAYITRRNVFII